MSQTHELKCDPIPFVALLSGEKSFEIRRDDRGYQEGDALWLREHFRPGSVGPLVTQKRGSYTGREVWRRVVYVLRDAGPATGRDLYGLRDGFVCMSIESMEAPDGH